MQKKTTPIATYRLQMNRTFPFSAAEKIVLYLSELGITDCYVSPITRPQHGSLHGYDVVSFDEINPELGGEKGLQQLSETLHEKKMGLLVDFVSNHMFTGSGENVWWSDVLMYGQESDYADCFDINWNSTYPPLKGKILIPSLAKVQHRALQDGDLDLVYDRGLFYIAYYDRWFPLHPTTWPMILQPVFNILSDKLQKPMPKTQEELDALHRESRDFRHVLDQLLEEWNDAPESGSTFRFLKNLLDKQAYRLSYFRMAYEHCNYRRFFDINELVGLQQEKGKTFELVHEQLFQWMENGWITGLRIDHVDGLADPKQYLDRLRKAMKKIGNSHYLLVEKILSEEEKLPTDWPVDGTTGYDFLNLLNGLFVLPSSRDRFEEIYQSFTGVHQGAREAVYRSKEIVLHTLFRGEVTALAVLFQQLAWERGEEADLEESEDMLREVLSWFPVYRTYLRPEEGYIAPHDQVLLLEAIAQAKAVRKDLSHELFATLIDLFSYPNGTPIENVAHIALLRQFQQLCSPIMAKGVEDTAFYRHYPLSSLNEVGAELGHFGVSRVFFHQKNKERQEQWPHTLLTTYTHDTKRSEDTRARINVLSEIPEEWASALSRWHEWNLDKRIDPHTPDKNEEYLIYQSLIGTWPLEEMDELQRDQYLRRIDGYMKKAVKEAKIHTSWVDPDDRHEKDIHLFLKEILNPATSRRFYDDFQQFTKKIQKAGMWNSLSQLVLKATCPGIPDFYQGSELWNFRLVDPDNRQPVDYGIRKERLRSLKDEVSQNPLKTLHRCLDNMETGEIKLLYTWRLLQMRREYADLFTKGSYHPLLVEGEGQDHWIAYAREDKGQIAIVVVSRFFLTLFSPDFKEISQKDGSLHCPKHLPKEEATEVLTGKKRFIEGPKLDIQELIEPTHPLAIWIC